jgi:XTP/dITP diphosphohydrolase
MASPVATPVAVDGAANEDELGDQLLAIVAAARAKGLDPERALRGSIRTLQGNMRATEEADRQM